MKMTELSEHAMTTSHLRGALEAVLMLADMPIPTTRLAAVLAQPEPRVQQTLTDLAQEYHEQDRGFILRELGEGWRFYSHPTYAEEVEAFVRDGQTARLTAAALETLAVIAYRQPVARGRISSIRGVNVDGVVRTLLTRGLIEEAGRDGDSGAILYQTTAHFLERMGLRSIADLPPLAPYLPEVGALDDILEGDR